jgi:ribose transport system permease protein
MSAAARLIGLQRRYPLAQLLALALLYLSGAATISGFTQQQSIRSMLVLAAFLGLAACGQTLVFIVGGIDLSVAGFIVMGAVMVSQLCGADHWPVGGAVALITTVAALAGACVGWACHRYRVNPLVVTLGVGSIASGAVIVWTHSRFTAGAPQAVSDLVAANGTTLGVGLSPIVVIWAAVAVAVGVVLARTVFGRRLYASGDNPRAAELALISTSRVWTLTFALSATLSALVGVLLAGFSGADRSLGDPYVFEGLAAVVVGGTAFGGSRGSYSNTVIGSLILVVLTTILVGHGFDRPDQQIVFGLLILVIAAGYGREHRLRDRI